MIVIRSVIVAFVLALGTAARADSDVLGPMPFGGLSAAEYKREVPCPEKPGLVVVVAGQSNAANYGGEMTSGADVPSLFNYFFGKCYVAEDPLLGSDGNSGSAWVLLGRKLIETGKYHSIVLASVAVGGTSIERWRKGGDLNGMLKGLLQNLVDRGMTPGHFYFVQGEADRGSPIGAENGKYSAAMDEVLDTARSVAKPDIFIGVTSSCPNQSSHERPNENVRSAQLSKVSRARRIFVGADLDGLRAYEDRFDLCHLTGKGLHKMVDQWFQSIIDSRQP